MLTRFVKKAGQFSLRHDIGGEEWKTATNYYSRIIRRFWLR